MDLAKSTLKNSPPRADNSVATKLISVSRRNALGFLAAAGTGFAQQRRTAAPPELLGRGAYPLGVSMYLQPLGDRVTLASKQQLAITATLADSSEKSSVSIQVQQPNKVLIQRAGAKAATLSWDGATSRSTSAAPRKDEDDLLETFASDFPDAFFSAVMSGGGVRLLGQGFRPAARDYAGPAWDVFELLVGAGVRRSGQTQVKRFYFDHATRLLGSTRYNLTTAGSGPSGTVWVETHYSSWRELSGTLLPTRVERYEGGALRFAIDVTNVTARAKDNDNIFQTVGPAKV